MFDPNSLVLNGVGLLVLVFGLVEFLKSVFSLSGRIVTVLSFILGVVLALVYLAVPLLPDLYQTIVSFAVTALVAGLAASGFYKFQAARIARQ